MKNRLSNMNKSRRQEFYDAIDLSISDLHEGDLEKLEFARNLTDDLLGYLDTDDTSQIHLGPMDRKTFEYFIFIILVEYHAMDWKF